MTHEIYWIRSSTQGEKYSSNHYFFRRFFDRLTHGLTHEMTHAPDKPANCCTQTNAAPKIFFLQFFPQSSRAGNEGNTPGIPAYSLIIFLITF